jgi:hypothetical protein
MKILARTIILVAAVAATTAFAGLPPVNVTVSNAGKASFKGRTDAKGTFATGTLPQGNYTVQFNSNAPDLKGKKYAIVVSAGTKKVSSSVAGEKFAGGGVAMKVDVPAGLNITGQVAADESPTSKSGKKMVWIMPATGSNMPGHWAEEDSAEAKEARVSGRMSRKNVQDFQDRGMQPQGN